MKIVLKPYQTIEQVRAQDRLRVDAGKVHDAIRTNPGIPSKLAIEAKTGLPVARVAEVLKRIKAGETGHVLVEYGSARPKSGPFAGRTVTGWFPMTHLAYHQAMDDADEHSALVEVGVRRSRLVRFAQAQGIRRAGPVVALIEERLGLSIEAMTQADLEAFEELLVEAAEAAESEEP